MLYKGDNANYECDNYEQVQFDNNGRNKQGNQNQPIHVQQKHVLGMTIEDIEKHANKIIENLASAFNENTNNELKILEILSHLYMN